MKIGDIVISNKTILAPMRAVGCPSFRKICRKYGAGLVVTQVFWSWEIDKWKDRLVEEFPKDESPIAVQVGGNNPEELKKAVQLLEPYADIIDINFGCPEKEVCGHKSGAFLMLHPEQLERAAKAVVEATDKPVTAKIRLGWDKNSINVVEVAKRLESVGVAAITVHARTRKENYSIKAQWEWIKKVKDAVSIPVIGNGDVFTPQGAELMIEKTGCDAIMIGRQAKGNPFLFSQINEWLENGKEVHQSSNERLDDFFCFAESYHEIEKDRSVGEFRDHALWFLKGMKEVSEIRQEISKSESIEEIEKLMLSMLD
jgi:tRNA-dihydrouridine synthase B